MLMEAMGLQLPGALINPDTPLREALTQAAAEHITRVTRQAGNLRPLGKVLDERSFVNAVAPCWHPVVLLITVFT